MTSWSDLQPNDGYFASVIKMESQVILAFGLRLKGKIANSRTVAKFQASTNAELTPAILGDFHRKLIVLEAIAEYLNAGGVANELPGLLPDANLASICIPGWNYFDGGYDANSFNRVHEFVDDSCTKFVRWIRNRDIVTALTLEDIYDDSSCSSADPEHIDFADYSTEGETDIRVPGISGPTADC